MLSCFNKRKNNDNSVVKNQCRNKTTYIRNAFHVLQFNFKSTTRNQLFIVRCTQSQYYNLSVSDVVKYSTHTT